MDSIIGDSSNSDKKSPGNQRGTETHFVAQISSKSPDFMG